MKSTEFLVAVPTIDEVVGLMLLRIKVASHVPGMKMIKETSEKC
jgi:hypothetical protein